MRVRPADIPNPPYSSRTLFCSARPFAGEPESGRLDVLVGRPRRRLNRERVSMPVWERGRMPRRSARTSFRCIGRRRSRPRRRRKVRRCSTFGHGGPGGYDAQTRLVFRSCRSFRPTRPAHRRPRHRTRHDVPRPDRLMRQLQRCRHLSIPSGSNEPCMGARRAVYRHPSSTPAGSFEFT